MKTGTIEKSEIAQLRPLQRNKKRKFKDLNLCEWRPFTLSFHILSFVFFVLKKGTTTTEASSVSAIGWLMVTMVVIYS